jgi:hypothetical protein
VERAEQITAESILRRRAFNGVPEIQPWIVPKLQTVTAASITAAIRERLAQSDAGVSKRFANTFLEPPNPFNPKARRRPKQDFVILGVLFIAALGLALYFNITAVISLHSGY